MMDNADGFQIPKDYDLLRRQYEQLHTENLHLLRLLAENGIPYKKGTDLLQAIPVGAPQETSAVNAITDIQCASTIITRKSSLEERIKLYLSLFRGRRDVYACQSITKKEKLVTVPLAGTNGSEASAASQL